MTAAIASSVQGAHARCPRCKNRAADLLLPASIIRRELDWRTAFFSSRFGRFRPGKPIKDLDDVSHSAAADLFVCPACDIVMRDEHADFEIAYRDEWYDARALEMIFDAHFSDCESISEWILPLLAGRKAIVEVGSYSGAFLEFAKRSKCHAIGVDIGRNTSRFANSHGSRTLCCAFEDAAFASGSIDAVFVWNCFEQLFDPESLVAEAHRVLSRSGLLVIRTPHAAFYRLCHDLDAPRERVAFDDRRIRLLAYSNLLGFPHEFGFTPESLRIFVERLGFVQRDCVTRFPSIFPRPAAPDWVVAEEASTRELAEEIRAMTNLAPWFESVFQRVDGAGVRQSDGSRNDEEM